jgi:hypothetical protein
MTLIYSVFMLSVANKAYILSVFTLSMVVPQQGVPIQSILQL